MFDEYNFCMLIWLSGLFDSESLVAGMPISESILLQCFRYLSKDHVSSTHNVK